jgi:hypothetical protein
MTMITQTVDPHHFVRRARQIKARIPVILSQWGLVPKFKRWRLAQDPETGMVILFGVLNNKYIATHTKTPFSDYFDPRLLHDLATELQVQVIPSANDGLRYAFILERGQIDMEPAHIDYPFQDGNSSFVKTIQSAKPVPEVIVLKITPAPIAPIAAENVDDQTLVDRGVGAFLKVFDDIKLRDDAAQTPAVQDPPVVVVIEVEKPTDDINLHRRSGDEKLL